jgi:hypothetical protein
MLYFCHQIKHCTKKNFIPKEIISLRMPSFAKIVQRRWEMKDLSTEQWWNDTDRGNWSVKGKPWPSATVSNTKPTEDFYNSYNILGQVNKLRWDGGGGKVALWMELEIYTGFWTGNLKITLVFWNTVPDYKITVKWNLEKYCFNMELNETGRGVLSNGGIFMKAVRSSLFLKRRTL